MFPKIVTMNIGVSWSNLTSTFFQLGGNGPPTRYDCVLLVALTKDWLKKSCCKMGFVFIVICMFLMNAAFVRRVRRVMSCFQEGRYAGGWWIYQQTWVDWISNSQWWNCLWLLLSTKQCRLFGRRRCTSFVGQGTWWSNFTDQHCIQCCTAVLDKPRFCCVSRWKKWKLSLVFGSGVEKYVHHPVWGCFVRLYMMRSIFPKLLLGY